MKPEEIKNLIEYYASLWKEHKKSYCLQDLFIEGTLRRVAGYWKAQGDELSEYPIVLIPVTEVERYGHTWWDTKVKGIRDDILNFDVFCGVTPEARDIFSQKGIREFLEAFKIEFIVGCVHIAKGNGTDYMKVPLMTFAFEASPEVQDAFAYFVGKYGCNLYTEDYRNWSVFKSE